ncbi:dTDP-4-dehydrorhamnose 3,5-epimerase [Idiomarina sp. Sol25]|uniref:dTDP-4-dehydrorhamnose 3,5-epimerase n=1 Tax=Idiomarina sp. Sol25 TaxID=3064000 RepID=UPI00294B7185|nr:dTDP-4-dehydrorhamnose 3,5-epimerase [Idiomarina sp. Sol25]MDV6328087.1 dTDP-4-dehydrorhamnose 3,5-epimerase [Idiomarina sp. Sol25]
MNYQPQKIPDIKLITPTVFGDERGFFMETFRLNEFQQHCGDFNFVQDNHSKSKKGILRGLHYQLKRPQGKLVRVTQGRVFDVVVDMRAKQPTFGQWVGTELSAENKHQLWIPPGFAHGFYVLSDTAEFCYKCTDYYAPDDEHSVRWDDPTLAIDWPLDGEPVLSDKDTNAKMFQQAPAVA